MKLFTLALGGNALDFNTDGSVNNAAGAAQGSWTARSTTKTNGMTYTPAGAGAPSAISVQYGINANNQLTLVVPAAPAVAALAATTIDGFIVVEDNQDFVYYAMENDDPDNAKCAFYLYGAVAVDPDKNQLTIDMGAGNVLAVAGVVLSGNSALSTNMADNALDKIEFDAITHNPEASGAAIDVPAEILLTGKWDVQDGQIKFGINYDSTGTTSTLAITIVGKIKGVAAGFEFYSSGGASRLLFTIQGSINGTDNSGNWELSIGYANNILTASGNISDTIVTPGGSLALAGSFTISKGVGPLVFDVQLQATWKFTNGQLNVVINGSNGLYGLSLSGNLTIGNDWKVTFAVSKDIAGAASFQISVGYAPPNSALNGQLTLYCANNKVSLKAGLTITLDYVNGSLLPAAPAAAPAAVPVLGGG